jgi:hypothetical protein
VTVKEAGKEHRYSLVTLHVAALTARPDLLDAILDNVITARPRRWTRSTSASGAWRRTSCGSCGAAATGGCGPEPERGRRCVPANYSCASVISSAKSRMIPSGPRT